MSSPRRAAVSAAHTANATPTTRRRTKEQSAPIPASPRWPDSETPPIPNRPETRRPLRPRSPERSKPGFPPDRPKPPLRTPDFLPIEKIGRFGAGKLSRRPIPNASESNFSSDCPFPKPSGTNISPAGRFQTLPNPTFLPPTDFGRLRDEHFSRRPIPDASESNISSAHGFRTLRNPTFFPPPDSEAFGIQHFFRIPTPTRSPATKSADCPKMRHPFLTSANALDPFSHPREFRPSEGRAPPVPL